MSHREAWKFFLQHAGYATPPGPAQCALDLARAEAWAKAEGLVFVWDNDPDADDSWMDDTQRQQEHTAEGCTVYRRCEDCGEISSTPLNGLYGIFDADSDYRRVVEAELASDLFVTHSQSEAI